MAPRRHVDFEALWRMPIEVPYSLLVREGDLAWSCGQCPLDRDARVLAPDDLVAQTAIVCDYIETVLGRAELLPDALGQLILYHVPGTGGSTARMLQTVRARLGPAPVLVPVAVPHFYYDGMLIEVDVYAGVPCRPMAIGDAGSDIAVSAVATGDLVRVGVEIATATPESLARLPAVLERSGLPLSRMLAAHWFAPSGSSLGRSAQVLEAAGLVPDAGLVVGTPPEAGEAVHGALAFVREGRVEARSETRSGIRVGTRAAGRHLWLSARSDAPLGLLPETEAIMVALEAALVREDGGFADVAKSTTHYRGGSTPAELHDNMAIRNRRYRRPGPASTGLPVAALAAPGAITVDLQITRRALETD